MSAAHTPGPWVFGSWPNGKAGVVPDEGWVDVWAPTESGNGLPFVACKHNDQEANARLIAAAPDLLAALQRLMGGTGTMQDALEAHQQARAAINKATGAAQ